MKKIAGFNNNRQYKQKQESDLRAIDQSLLFYSPRGTFESTDQWESLGEDSFPKFVAETPFILIPLAYSMGTAAARVFTFVSHGASVA